MHLLAPMAGLVCLCAWIYLLIAHGDFWRVGELVVPKVSAAQIAGIIAVVIPARDEAEVIGPTIRSLLAQSCAHAFRIVVVDDQSEDDTARVVRETAAAYGRPEAVEVIAGASLPAGWTGKLWAVHQGIRRALESDPEFLLLTDADISHAPESVATLVAIANSGPFDLTSSMVTLHCRTVAEKLLVPAFVFFSLCSIRRTGFAVRGARPPERRVDACSSVRMLWSAQAALRPYVRRSSTTAPSPRPSSAKAAGSGWGLHPIPSVRASTFRSARSSA